MDIQFWYEAQLFVFDPYGPSTMPKCRLSGVVLGRAYVRRPPTVGNDGDQGVNWHRMRGIAHSEKPQFL